MFQKAIEHLLDARKLGDTSIISTALLGSAYYFGEEYGIALLNLMKAKKRGHLTKQNESQIGNCYMIKGKTQEHFEKGLDIYENTLNLILDEDFEDNFMHAFDHELEKGFSNLENSSTLFDTPENYVKALERFKEFYKGFTKYWEKHEKIQPDRFYKLYGANPPETDRIKSALERASKLLNSNSN